MTNDEKTAFVDAYARHVAHLPKERVMQFVDQYLSNDDMDFAFDETGIVDALGIWFEATKYILSTNK